MSDIPLPPAIPSQAPRAAAKQTAVWLSVGPLVSSDSISLGFGVNSLHTQINVTGDSRPLEAFPCGRSRRDSSPVRCMSWPRPWLSANPRLPLVRRVKWISPPRRTSSLTSYSYTSRPSLEVDKEIAGLSASSHPEVLNWERVYAMALVRARRGPGLRAEALDPKAIAEQATRNGFDDFGRFRKEFLAARRRAVGVSTTRAATSSRSWTGSRVSTMRNGMPHFMRMYSHCCQNSSKASPRD